MTEIIILAAGKGRRMGTKLPKVLVPLNGRPMISYLLDSVKALNIGTKPILVVSPDNIDLMKEQLQEYNVKYALQTEQLGTGHAVASAKDQVNPKADKVIVLYGDHPFIKSDSIEKLYTNHRDALSLMSVKLEDFADWRQGFYRWGRLVRSNNGALERIVEFKDASDEIKNIKEVFPAIFCLDANWLWENIAKLKNNNNQKEYYLTDLVGMAFAQGREMQTTVIEPQEGMGINSQAELKIAQENIINN